MHERILIDPGHGGNDPGAIGHVREVDITHDWGAELANQINNLGGDTYVLPDGINWKNDLELPVNTANAYGNPWLYVSIHANAGGGTGAEIYIHPSVWCSPTTASLAHSTFNAYMSVAKKHGMSSRGVKPGDFSVLRETNNRAVLIELGFVDNASDAKLLADPTFRTEACKAMARALMLEAGQVIK